MAFDDDNLDGITDTHDGLTDDEGGIVLPNEVDDNWEAAEYRRGAGDTDGEENLDELGFTVVGSGSRVDDADLDGFGTEEEML